MASVLASLPPRGSFPSHVRLVALRFDLRTSGLASACPLPPTNTSNCWIKASVPLCSRKMIYDADEPILGDNPLMLAPWRDELEEYLKAKDPSLISLMKRGLLLDSNGSITFSSLQQATDYYQGTLPTHPFLSSASVLRKPGMASSISLPRT